MTPTLTRRGDRIRRAGPGDVLLKRLPGNSLMHRLWAGTKLLGLAILTIAVLLRPSWGMIIALGVVTVVVVIAARVPRSAVPRMPGWFWLSVLIGLALSWFGGNLESSLQVLALTAAFIVLSAVVTWTTALEDLAPAVATLGTPLRWVRVPVEEWAVTTVLCIRSLPLLVEELRVLFAARRLRGRSGRRRAASAVEGLIDVLTAATASTIRRANDLGAALAARGGAMRLNARRVRIGWTDVVALVVVAGCSAVPFIFSV
jgi:energy-coupling factor transport system permease protein